MSHEQDPLWKRLQDDLVEVSTLASLTEVRDRFLSRQRGLLSLRMRELAALPSEERPVAGQHLNRLKKAIEGALRDCEANLSQVADQQQLSREWVDVTQPGYGTEPGRIHPLRRIQREMEDVFVRMGFEIVSGPEIETDYYNFEALNIPTGHPARDDQDTLYLEGGFLLRTHSSPVQIRTMENRKPPLRIVVPGRVYRRDTADATHSPMFHQLEGLVVGEGISLADLKGTLEVFFSHFFASDTRVRMRPSYFPFVEPGAEVDVSCLLCQGQGCRVCRGSGWIEILGAGMVHPAIFERVGYDPERYTGFAWGMGIDRIALLKYQVDGLKHFFDNDLRFLRQF